MLIPVLPLPSRLTSLCPSHPEGNEGARATEPTPQRSEEWGEEIILPLLQAATLRYARLPLRSYSLTLLTLPDVPTPPPCSTTLTSSLFHTGRPSPSHCSFVSPPPTAPPPPLTRALPIGCPHSFSLTAHSALLRSSLHASVVLHSTSAILSCTHLRADRSR